MKKSIILINDLPANPEPDEQDVIAQADAVESTMQSLGYQTGRLVFSLDLKNMKDKILKSDPEVVFNLVETVDDKAELIYLPVALLESMDVPYTGSGSYTMYVTSKKIAAKKHFRRLGIPTPDWFTSMSTQKPVEAKKYILKPMWEDGSVGISDHSVIEMTREFRDEFFSDPKYKRYFLEDYIDGREFNLSILGGKEGPTVMPAAEILYVDYPEDKPKILGYASKWHEHSFEYNNTPRTFDLSPDDAPLVEKMIKICLRCWNGFDMKGFVRVDFRVDENNNPFVLEVNANPCISPDAGFIAACRQGGFDYPAVVERIIYDALT